MPLKFFEEKTMDIKSKYFILSLLIEKKNKNKISPQSAILRNTKVEDEIIPAERALSIGTDS